MAISRTLLLKYAPFIGVGWISLLVTMVAIAGPVLMHYLTQKTGLGRFLFERPAWARVETPSKQRLEGAAGLNPAE
jgi:uncharacterized membrane protein YcfT